MQNVFTKEAIPTNYHGIFTDKVEKYWCGQSYKGILFESSVDQNMLKILDSVKEKLGIKLSNGIEIPIGKKRSIMFYGGKENIEDKCTVKKEPIKFKAGVSFRIKF